MRITAEHLDDLALGAAILGTGGGGNPYIGTLLAKQSIRAYGPVELVSVDDVPEDAFVLPVAMMGAPTVLVEKLPNGAEAVDVFELLRQRLALPVDYTISGEAGGINSMIPFVVAARLGISLVDGDLMGRAFPELQMTIPSLLGIAATPMALADDKGNRVLLETVSNRWTERLARSATIEMGCAAMFAAYALTGEQLRAAAVAGTLSLCLELGRLVHEARAAHADPTEVVVERLGGVRLFGGKVIDVDRRTVEGFARVEARIEGVGADAGETLVVQAQNEWLVAARDGEIVASVPDLIILLDSESGEPITTEDLRYGFRVAVIGAPCDARWRSEAGLELVGPRYFGYDIDYLPIEHRVSVAVRGES